MNILNKYKLMDGNYKYYRLETITKNYNNITNRLDESLPPRHPTPNNAHNLGADLLIFYN